MREEDTYQDLASLFSAEDRQLDAKPFVDDVMRGIRRRALMRKLVIAGVGAVGAIVAASQMPSLVGDWITFDDAIVTGIADARQQVGLLATINPLWLAIAAVAGLSFTAVATMERA
ncbi:MAG: hypothetical protein R3C13_08065 [Hyphomonas sp.]|uniref:hypothetical protein n=1 Tax=Hyphomonas sp. TaxID=87 RepID=UPI00352778D6